VSLRRLASSRSRTVVQSIWNSSLTQSPHPKSGALIPAADTGPSQVTSNPSRRQYNQHRPTCQACSTGLSGAGGRATGAETWTTRSVPLAVPPRCLPLTEPLPRGDSRERPRGDAEASRRSRPPQTALAPFGAGGGVLGMRSCTRAISSRRYPSCAPPFRCSYLGLCGVGRTHKTTGGARCAVR
jgi:hypothetical protein